MTFNKIKRFCGFALIPRILRDDVTQLPQKLRKRPVDGFLTMAKSTDSKDRDAECEKCKKIIEMVFGREKPESHLKQVEGNVQDVQIDKIQNIFAPNITMNEKTNENNTLLPIERINNETESVQNITSDNVDESIKKNLVDQSTMPVDNILESTTSTTTEEQLEQKLETIQEPTLVEAAPKIDGFNTPLKMSGDQEKIYSKNSLCTKIASEEDAMDKIAKKCFDAPPDKIDERILEEMKNCGMLGKGKKKPTARNSGYHAMKYHERKSLQGASSQHSALYFKNQQDINSLLSNYLMRYNNREFDHKPQNFYPAYFKNVSMLNDDKENSEKGMNVQKITEMEHKKEKDSIEEVSLDNEKTLLCPSENIDKIDSDINSPIISDESCNKIEELEEEEKCKNVIKDDENEAKKSHVIAAETGLLGIPGEIEVDLDFDRRHAKSDILRCSVILKASETPIEKKIINSYQYKFANTRHPREWHLRPDLPDRPLINPETAISSTYPSIEQKQDPETEKIDTSISSNQNPAEYFDLSHCNMEQVQDNMSTLSEFQFLAAYNKYTILSDTDDAEESDQFPISTKYSPEIRTYHDVELKYVPEIETQKLTETLDKDVSAATEPLPLLRDLEEELTLTELLKRVRERNLLQYYREFSFKALQAEPIEANKCPPPLGKPGKTLPPGPCKPKPKPVCPPPPPACPPATPCKPKDPCAKFTTPSIIANKIRKVFTLVLQVAIKPVSSLLLILGYKDLTMRLQPLVQIIYDDDDASRTERLTSFLLRSSSEDKKDTFANEDVILAKDYEPWSPIPSWPIAKKEKKESFVCPKEGCKTITPPRLNSPCKQNPCVNLPKRTFSLIDLEYELFYVYHNRL